MMAVVRRWRRTRQATDFGQERVAARSRILNVGAADFGYFVGHGFGMGGFPFGAILRGGARSVVGERGAGWKLRGLSDAGRAIRLARVAAIACLRIS